MSKEERGVVSARQSARKRSILVFGALVGGIAKRLGGRDNPMHGGSLGVPAGEMANNPARGRQARRPGEIPIRGWRDVLIRVKNEMSEDHLSMVAAGIAFYAFLAIFPALAAMASIYGLFADPADLQRHVSSVEGLVPPEAASLISSELRQIVERQGSELGLAVVGGLTLALWSAAKGTKVMFESMNIAYDEKEKRGFLTLNALALLLTLGGIAFVIFFLVLAVAVPALLATLSIGGLASGLIDYARWPLLALGAMFGVAVLYRYGPSRKEAQWKWLSWGAVVATAIWLAGSFLFSFYVQNFGNYNKTYGSLGVIVILMTWFLLGAYSILLGAEINAELEHQTARDTTEDEPEPMGQRGAYVADSLGVMSEESGERQGINQSRH